MIVGIVSRGQRGAIREGAGIKRVIEESQRVRGRREEMGHGNKRRTRAQQKRSRGFLGYKL